MANEYAIRVPITGDTVDLDAALGRAQKSIAEFGRSGSAAVRVYNDAIKTLPDGIGRATAAIQALTNSYDPLGTKLRTLKEEYAALEDSTEKGIFGSGGAEQTAATMERIRAEIKSTESTMAGMGPAATASVQKIIDGFDPLGAKLRNLKAELQSLEDSNQKGIFGSGGAEQTAATMERIRTEIKSTESTMAGMGPAATASVQKIIDGFDPLGAKLRNLKAELQSLEDSNQKGIFGSGGAEQTAATMERIRTEIKSTESTMAGMGPAATASVQKIIDGMDPLGARLRALRVQYDALAQSMQKGLYGPSGKDASQAALVSLRDQMAQVSAEIANGKAQIKTFGEVGAKSAKELEWALRGVPMQFTDIFTSLAAGQSPMMVFLQQGGQLKDMFGGIGPAVRAVGGYALGLVNPFTLAAAAAAALGYAYYTGSKQADMLANSLIYTGNAAGKTAGQLQAMAQTVGKTSGAGQGTAADAIAALVGTGSIDGGQIQKLADSAARLQQVAGTAVADTVKQFADLGKDPVAASIRLNEQAHYLTASIFEQIKAFQDNGQTAKAAALAQNAWADAINERTAEVTKNLGYLESGWNAVAKAGKDAWQAMLNVGATETPEMQLQSVEKTIARIQAQLAQKGGQKGSWLAQLEVQETLKASLVETIKLSQKSVEIDQTKAKLSEATIKWVQSGEQFANNEAKRKKEIAAAQQEGLAAGIKQEEIEKRIAQIREKYKDPVRPGATLLAELTTQYQQLIGTGTEVEKVTLKMDAAKGQYNATERLAIVVQANEIDLLKKEADLRTAQIKNYADLATTFDAANDAYAGSLQTLLQSTNAQEFEAQMLGKTADQVARLRSEREQLAAVAAAAANAKSPADFAAIDALAARRKAANDQIFADAADQKTNPIRGVNDAVKEYTDNIKNYGLAAKDAMASVFKTLEDSIVTSAKTGKIELANIRDLLIDIALRKAAASVVANISGGLGSLATAVFSANGNAFTSSGVQAFANGGTFSGKVVNSPTAFAFAKGGGFGLGVMGEAGPEAVMPLTRGPGGKLGVQASGAANGPSTVIYQYNTIGDVASMAKVERMLSANNRQLTAGLARQQRYA